MPERDLPARAREHGEAGEHAEVVGAGGELEVAVGAQLAGQEEQHQTGEHHERQRPHQRARARACPASRRSHSPLLGRREQPGRPDHQHDHEDHERRQRHERRALVSGRRRTGPARGRDRRRPRPGGLSRPPSTAATNPMIRIGSKLFGPRNTDGATSTPASDPVIAASAQPSVSIRPTRTPSSRATSGENAAPRIRRPSRGVTEQRGEQRRDRDHHQHDERVVRARTAAWCRRRCSRAARTRPGTSGGSCPRSSPRSRRSACTGRASGSPRSAAARARPGGSARARRPRRARSRHASATAKPSDVGAARVDHRRGDERREHQHRALGEVDDPGRAPDQHERERDRGVDRAARDAVERVGR